MIRDSNCPQTAVRLVMPFAVTLQFKTGDRVFGLAPWFWMTFKQGTYAEYVSSKEEWLAYCPKSLPLHEAGQVPLVALTAWQVTGVQSASNQ